MNKTFASAGVFTALLGATASALFLAPCAQAVGFTDFAEYGTTVNGYQDDFNGTTLDSGWTVYGGDPNSFTPAGDGTLHITPTTSSGTNPDTDDPNKLLYTGASYSSTVQSVLMLIKVNNEDFTDDGWRVGAGAVSSSSTGQGINLVFRDQGPNSGPGTTPEHFNLLNDAIAWGPAVSGTDDSHGLPFTPGTYYWLRETYAQNTSGDDVTAEVWVAGQGEATATQTSWNYTDDPANFRTGFAGIVAGSLGGPVDASVDYVLIQAAGLPSINVVPEPTAAVSLLAGLGVLTMSRRRCRAAGQIAHV